MQRIGLAVFCTLLAGTACSVGTDPGTPTSGAAALVPANTDDSFGCGDLGYPESLTVDPSTGRPAEPDEATSHAVWRAWSERMKEDPTASLTPEDYLALGEDTGASLRAVWNLTQRWAEYGDLSHEGVIPMTQTERSDREPGSR